MRPLFCSALLLGSSALASLAPAPAAAQSYPIDCAILLCLAGGWPASEPCARARAEFIRRITPFPIEPPLQIWRCPMGATGRAPAGPDPMARLYAIGLKHDALSQAVSGAGAPAPVLAKSELGAGIDLSGEDFDFLRSLRVFQIDYSQSRFGRDDCLRRDSTRLGTYGPQGEYAWGPSSAAAVPAASALNIPSACGFYAYRAVFVEWRDQAGLYGYEEVRY